MDGYIDISNSSHSEVWKYFLKNKVQNRAKCNQCNQIYEIKSGSTTNLRSHLRSRHNVELVSATPNNVCSKHVRPIFGRAYQYEDGSIKNEGEMLGHVGVFAQDAPRVCGGKNAFDNLNTCYEFNATVNRY